MASRPLVPFDPARDAGPRGRRPRDLAAVDVAPDDTSLLGPAREPRSAAELAAYGAAGQGYPIYGVAPAEDVSRDESASGRRSDARIREDVCERLGADELVDASQISVAVSAGEVTLSGTVLDRRSKRRAEDVTAGVGGVLDVHNRLALR